MKITSAVQ